MFELYENEKAVFDIQLHLILAVQDRRKILTEPVVKRLCHIFKDIAPKYFADLEEINNARDVLHLHFRVEPQTEIDSFIEAFKAETNQKIKEEFPEVKEKLGEKSLWGGKYSLISDASPAIGILNDLL